MSNPERGFQPEHVELPKIKDVETLNTYEQRDLEELKRKIVTQNNFSIQDSFQRSVEIEDWDDNYGGAYIRHEMENKYNKKTMAAMLNDSEVIDVISKNIEKEYQNYRNKPEGTNFRSGLFKNTRALFRLDVDVNIDDPRYGIEKHLIEDLKKGDTTFFDELKSTPSLLTLIEKSPELKQAIADFKLKQLDAIDIKKNAIYERELQTFLRDVSVRPDILQSAELDEKIDDILLKIYTEVTSKTSLFGDARNLLTMFEDFCGAKKRTKMQQTLANVWLDTVVRKNFSLDHHHFNNGKFLETLNLGLHSEKTESVFLGHAMKCFDEKKEDIVKRIHHVFFVMTGKNLFEHFNEPFYHEVELRILELAKKGKFDELKFYSDFVLNTKESSFFRGVEERTGLSLNRIPDAEPEVMLGGHTVMRSGLGTLVFIDHDFQDENGQDFYNRAVIVGRTKNIPPADSDADGIMPKK